MEHTGLSETMVVTDSVLEESSFSGVAMPSVRFEDALWMTAGFDHMSTADAISHAAWPALASRRRPVRRIEKRHLAGGTIQNANLSGLSINDCNIAGLRIDGYLVSDLIAAHRKSV